MKLRVVGGCLLLATYSALVFDVLFSLTQANARVDDILATDGVAHTYLDFACIVVPIGFLGLLLPAAAFSAFVGRRWGLCVMACVCSMTSALFTFYWTAIIGTSALIFIARSRSEFVDLQKNPLPALGATILR